jgi:uncharacterized protein YecT (DUF1311 family)
MTFKHLQRNILGWVSLALLIGLLLSKTSHSAEVICDVALTTIEMESCMELRFKNAAETLSQLNKKIELILNNGEREAFRAADNGWARYRDANCKSGSILYQGGSLEGLVEISCKARMAEERIREVGQIFSERLRSSGSRK